MNEPVRPWHVGGGNDLIVYDSDGWAVANCIVYHGKTPLAQQQGLARLMASAPELQTSLAELVDCDVCYDGDRIIIRCANHADAIARVRAARAALAKGRVEG